MSNPNAPSKVSQVLKEIPLFRVWDKKYEKWMLARGEKGRSLKQYLREKWFKAGNLMWCDLEGFALTERGDLLLQDECGGEMYLDGKRFEVCFPVEVLAALEDSPSRTYKVLNP